MGVLVMCLAPQLRWSNPDGGGGGCGRVRPCHSHRTACRCAAVMP